MGLDDAMTVTEVSTTTTDTWRTEVRLTLTDADGHDHTFLLDAPQAATVAAYMAQAVKFMLTAPVVRT